MEYLTAFDRTVRSYADREAIRTSQGNRLSYAELDKRSNQVANALESIAPGQPVATLARNRYQVVEVMLASHKRGIGNVQLSFMDSLGGITQTLEPTDADVLIFDDENAEKALDVLDQAELSVGVSIGNAGITRSDVYGYDNLLERASVERPISQGSEHGVLFTSGTTSRSKAVPFDQEQLWYGSTQTVMEMGIEPRDIALVTTPWYHMVTTDAWILPHLQAGATLVMQRSFDPPATLDLLAKHEATGLLAVPTQLQSLVTEAQQGDYDVDALSYIRTGGSVVTSQLSEQVHNYLCEGLYNTYGLTEGGPNLTYSLPATQREKPGTIGKESFMWELRVVESGAGVAEFDPTAEVDPGETGEVIGRSPGMCDGYLERPQATEALFVDGWLRTGDIARIDADGHLYIVDRVDNMIISGSENIYPQEVEEALATHVDVDAVAVLGLDDETWGERVAAVVRTRDDGLGEEDLDAYCKSHDELANFARPREYSIGSQPLPRTDTGTIRREEVHDEFS